MSQIGQRAYDAVISPATVLACKPNHKRFHLRRDAWAAGIGTTAGTVELQRDQSAIPGEKGIRQPEPRRQVSSEDAILGRQVFISQQQFLIDKARYKGQQACPVESIVHDRKFMIAASTCSVGVREPPHRAGILTIVRPAKSWHVQWETNPTGGRVRDPVAWVAFVEETNRMKPTDKAILGMVSESPGGNVSEPRSGLDKKIIRRPSPLWSGEGSMTWRRLTE